MPNQKIDITDGDISTGVLTLSKKGNLTVDTTWDFRKITWEIKGGSNPVASFLLVSKNGVPQPFEQPLPTTYKTKVSLSVKDDVPIVDWKYSIIWNDTDGNPHTFDPIIAIRSSFHPRKSKNALIAGVLIGLGIIGISMLFLKTKKKW